MLLVSTQGFTLCLSFSYPNFPADGSPENTVVSGSNMSYYPVSATMMNHHVTGSMAHVDPHGQQPNIAPSAPSSTLSVPSSAQQSALASMPPAATISDPTKLQQPQEQLVTNPPLPITTQPFPTLTTHEPQGVTGVDHLTTGGTSTVSTPSSGTVATSNTAAGSNVVEVNYSCPVLDFSIPFQSPFSASHSFP